MQDVYERMNVSVLGTVYVYPCRHVRVYVLVHTHDTCLCMY